MSPRLVTFVAISSRSPFGHPSVSLLCHTYLIRCQYCFARAAMRSILSSSQFAGYARPALSMSWWESLQSFTSCIRLLHVCVIDFRVSSNVILLVMCPCCDVWDSDSVLAWWTAVVARFLLADCAMWCLLSAELRESCEQRSVDGGMLIGTVYLTYI